MAGSGNYDKCFQECKDICSKITFTGLLEKQDLHELYQMADIVLYLRYSNHSVMLQLK